MMHKISVTLHNFKNNNNNKFEIEERRRKVSSLLAQSMTENEIAQELGVGQSTISRDIKALKELSQQFVFDLAKSDLAFYYKQCIDGIEEVKKKAWEMLRNNSLIEKTCMGIRWNILWSFSGLAIFFPFCLILQTK